MAQFAITVGGTKYTLGDDGGVSTAAGAFGSWTTDGKASNAILLVPTGGGATITAPVTWAFNDANQLVVSDASGDLFNFGTGSRSEFTLDFNNLVRFNPNDNSSFEFPLVCSFALNDEVDLLVTIGSKTSTVKGKPSSHVAQFGYAFDDLKQGERSYFFGFTGEWVRDDKADGIKLSYKGKAGGKAFVFKLPDGAKLSSNNQLEIVGSKQDGEGWSIEIKSTLVIQKNFLLLFRLEKQATAAGVTATTIQVQAKFEPNKDTSLNGALALEIVDRKNSQMISLTGKAHATFGQFGMDIVFSYAKTSGPGQSAVVAAMVGASFKWNNGGTLELTFGQQDDRRTLSLTSGFSINDKIRVQVYLNVTQANKKKGVYGALGISF